jgi:hypothetical protein
MDFVKAFTLADVEREMYMELPNNFKQPRANITYESRYK